MAFSYTESVGDGVKTAFTFRFSGDGFGYFRASDIHVYVAGTEVTNWSLTSPNTITIGTAPVMGAKVVIRRIMPKDMPYSIWTRGNDFSPLNVNNSFLQQLYALQEIYDGFMTEGFRFNEDLSMGGHKITDLADGVSPDDAVNLRQLNLTEGSCGESARAAAESASKAKESELNAKQSEVNAKESETIAGQYKNASLISETAARASAVIAKENADASELSKQAASVSETESAKSASAAKISENKAKEDAGRAQFWADKIDVNALNARIDAQDAIVNQSAIDSSEAKGIANTASATATQAKTIAEGIDAKATQAVQTANEAKASADSVVGIANEANTTAGEASTAAAAAQAKAIELGFPNLGITTEEGRKLRLFVGENLDLITSTGFYIADNSCPNIPLAEWGYLEVFRHSGKWMMQRWTVLTQANGREFVRIQSDTGGWHPWVETMKFNRFTFTF